MLCLSTDSSSTLATHIEQSAPADVLSADTTQPTRLVEGGYASWRRRRLRDESSRHPPERCCLFLRTPADARWGRDHRGRRRRADHEVPAEELVANLADEAGLPLAAAYDRERRVPRDNVKAINRQDRARRGRCRHRCTSPSAHARPPVCRRRSSGPMPRNASATYAWVCFVNASPNQMPPTAFLDWFAGPDGQSILASFGFGSPTRRSSGVLTARLTGLRMAYFRVPALRLDRPTGVSGPMRGGPDGMIWAHRLVCGASKEWSLTSAVAPTDKLHSSARTADQAMRPYHAVGDHPHGPGTHLWACQVLTSPVRGILCPSQGPFCQPSCQYPRGVSSRANRIRTTPGSTGRQARRTSPGTPWPRPRSPMR